MAADLEACVVPPRPAHAGRSTAVHVGLTVRSPRGVRGGFDRHLRESLDQSASKRLLFRNERQGGVFILHHSSLLSYRAGY
jgi:hypothetical protein